MKRSLLFFLVFIVICSAAAQTQKKFRFLLITGMGRLQAGHPYSNWHHDHYNQLLADYVRDFAEIRSTTDLSVLHEDSLKRYDLIINNSLFMQPTDAQQKAFFKFIESGKPYFAIHAGHVSFLNTDQYLTMLGGRFINHDDIKTFEVMTCDFWYGWEAESKSYKHPIVRNVDHFKTLDELYLMQFTTADVEVIARAEYHPIMWTRKFGSGNILCLTLGHGEFSQLNPGFKALFVNGVKWLTGTIK
ncbi:MAG TPA: ThuA domain-containing protein [Chryseolinea sp.]